METIEPSEIIRVHQALEAGEKVEVRTSHIRRYISHFFDIVGMNPYWRKMEEGVYKLSMEPFDGTRGTRK